MNEYLFRKVHGGWILQFGMGEEAEEEVFVDGIALLHKLNEVISAHDSHEAASGAANKAIQDKTAQNRKSLKLD